jgi:hypothetical protein
MTAVLVRHEIRVVLIVVLWFGKWAKTGGNELKCTVELLFKMLRQDIEKQT